MDSGRVNNDLDEEQRRPPRPQTSEALIPGPEQPTHQPATTLTVGQQILFAQVKSIIEAKRDPSSRSDKPSLMPSKEITPLLKKLSPESKAKFKDYTQWLKKECLLTGEIMNDLADPYTITYTDTNTLTLSSEALQILCRSTVIGEVHRKLTQAIETLPMSAAQQTLRGYAGYPMWVTSLLADASRVKKLEAEEKAAEAFRQAEAAKQKVSQERKERKERFLNKVKPSSSKIGTASVTAAELPSAPIPTTPASASTNKPEVLPVSETSPSPLPSPTTHEPTSDGQSQEPSSTPIKKIETRPEARTEYQLRNNGKLHGRAAKPREPSPTFAQMSRFSAAQRQPGKERKKTPSKPLTQDPKLDEIIFTLLDEKAATAICQAIGNIETYRLRISNDGPSLSSPDSAQYNEYPLATKEMKTLRQTLKSKLGSLDLKEESSKAIACGWIKDYFEAIQRAAAPKNLPAPPSSLLKKIFIVASFILVGFAIGFGVGWLAAGAALNIAALEYGVGGAGVGLLASYYGVGLFSPRPPASAPRSQHLEDIYSKSSDAQRLIPTS